MIRLIAIDIDGTLLDSRWQLSDQNRDAILAAYGRGIEIVLVTGRRFHFALPIAEQLPCPLTLIVNNGAVIKSKPGETLARHLLPRAIARKIVAGVPEFKRLAILVFDVDGSGQIVMERAEWDNPRVAGYLERNRKYIREAVPLESAITEDPIQVMYTGGVAEMNEVERCLRALDCAEEFALAKTEYPARDFTILDAIRQGCSKGAALKEWVGRRGIPREQVMAIGDNLNDEEMLFFSGLPVVMENSVEALKRNGWTTTLSNDQSGVAAAIQSLVLDPPECGNRGTRDSGLTP
jgi:Cof subfamily protein (haloacid dehalogenase superfamily)